MRDNFNIHSWKLKQAINELNERQLCKECGSGYMEEGQCMECGYMEEGATFTDKHDDNPKLKGGQKDLPDELQAQLVKNEAATPLADLYDLIEKLVAQGVSKDEILRIVNFATAKLNEGEDIFADIEDDIFHGTDSKRDAIEYLQEIIDFCQKKIADLEDAELNENEDHEVSMAQNSLKSIISSASQLMSKLGDNERNIPGWIQDHIAKSENYIEQANQSFHELEDNNETVAEEKEKVDEGLGIVSAITILIASLLANPISGPMIIGLFKYLFQDLPEQRRAAKELRAYNGPDKKEQVLALAKEIESQLSSGKKKYLTSLVNIIGKAKLEDEAKAYQELDLYAKRQKNLMNRELNENLNVDIEAALKDFPIPSNEAGDEAVVEDYDFDAQSFGGALKSNNPEGDALVLRFLKGVAKKFDYPVAQAAIFVKERIKKLGY